MQRNAPPKFIVLDLPVPAEDEIGFRYGLAHSGARVVSTASIAGERAYTLTVPDELSLARFFGQLLGPAAPKAQVARITECHVRRAVP